MDAEIILERTVPMYRRAFNWCLSVGFSALYLGAMSALLAASAPLPPVVRQALLFFVCPVVAGVGVVLLIVADIGLRADATEL